MRNFYSPHFTWVRNLNPSDQSLQLLTVLVFPNADPLPCHPDETFMTGILVGGGHNAIGKAALDISCLRDWKALEFSSASRAALISWDDFTHHLLLTPPPPSNRTSSCLTLALSQVNTVRLLQRSLADLSALYIMNHTGGQDNASEEE